MRVALGIYRMRPRGGLEDHCIRIAETLSRRGHDVVVHSVEPVSSSLFSVQELRLKGRSPSNHARMTRFADAFAAVRDCDRSVAFQPAPGVDILYCADPPRSRQGWRNLLLRHRTYARLEAACFARQARTRIMLVSPRQAEAFRELYGTPAERLAVVPPSIEMAKRGQETPTPARREGLRSALGIAAGEPAWLWVGLQPFVKGLDRVVDALVLSPAARLLVAGLPKQAPALKVVRKRIVRLGLEHRVIWLGYLSASRLIDAMHAADVLAHPARADVTGSVILEAIINGLPVVVSEQCGFAFHVERSRAGLILSSPLEIPHLARALEAGAAERWRSAHGIRYGQRENLYSGIEVAARLIEAADWTGEDAVGTGDQVFPSE